MAFLLAVCAAGAAWPATQAFSLHNPDPNKNDGRLEIVNQSTRLVSVVLERRNKVIRLYGEVRPEGVTLVPGSRVVTTLRNNTFTLYCVGYNDAVDVKIRRDRQTNVLLQAYGEDGPNAGLIAHVDDGERARQRVLIPPATPVVIVQPAPPAVVVQPAPVYVTPSPVYVQPAPIVVAPRRPIYVAPPVIHPIHRPYPYYAPGRPVYPGRHVYPVSPGRPGTFPGGGGPQRNTGGRRR